MLFNETISRAASSSASHLVLSLGGNAIRGCSARRSLGTPLPHELQEGLECELASGGRAQVGDFAGRASALRGGQGAARDHRRSHKEGDHGGRDPEEHGDQRVGAALLLRRQAHGGLRPGGGLHAAPGDRAAAGDGRQVVPERVRVRRRGAGGHQLPAGDAGHGVGVCGGEGDGADGGAAAVQPQHERAGVLRGRRAALHVRITCADHERRVDGRAQLRAVHGPGGAVERAAGDAGVPVAGGDGAHPRHSRLPLECFEVAEVVLPCAKRPGMAMEWKWDVGAGMARVDVYVGR